MLSADDEQWKHLDDPHTPLCVGKSTKEQWDRLQEQTALLHERLWLVWEKRWNSSTGDTRSRTITSICDFNGNICSNSK